MNVVLWLAEQYKQSDFRHETLFSWVLRSLRLLKRSVKRNNLPYYMIPKRNLLKEKLNDSSSQRLNDID